MMFSRAKEKIQDLTNVIRWTTAGMVGAYLWAPPKNERPEQEPAKADPRKLQRLAILESVYDEGYKIATGEGLRNKEAHLAGLDAVHVHTIAWRFQKPLKTRIHSAVIRLERRLRM